MIRRNLLAAAMALPFLAHAGAEAAVTPRLTARKKRVLLIGVDPSQVDYSKLPEKLDAQKLSAILEDQKAELAKLGCSARWCFIDTGPTAHHKVADVLQAAQFDVISIGAGVRLPPENFLLFERVVNVVHHHAQSAKICFSQTANDTVAAVQRWL